MIEKDQQLEENITNGKLKEFLLEQKLVKKNQKRINSDWSEDLMEINKIIHWKIWRKLFNHSSNS